MPEPLINLNFPSVVRHWCKGTKSDQGRATPGGMLITSGHVSECAEGYTLSSFRDPVFDLIYDPECRSDDGSETCTFEICGHIPLAAINIARGFCSMEKPLTVRKNTCFERLSLFYHTLAQIIESLCD